MHTLVIIVHIIACFLMIGAILLQSGKGAEFSEQIHRRRGHGLYADLTEPRHSRQREDFLLDRHRFEEKRNFTARTGCSGREACERLTFLRRRSSQRTLNAVNTGGRQTSLTRVLVHSVLEHRREEHGLVVSQGERREQRSATSG